ncbi:hypothetical protein ACFQ1E_17855 [Sphingomonas canadensis]|uniref:Uncharacterized protein n=1 Tax=Sphingomonas canadensis TaxID=1219257 RepID=A0ABW3HCR5_9SPHN|nr:hypothetical protein [Sphingomonas canadensis]MCW3837993.1 hypothetical protein [Sphingomonas canadensis]
MARLIGMALIGAITVYPTSVAAKEDFPPNVTIAKDKTVEMIDWSFPINQPLDFSRLKRCVATNIHGDEVQLRDSAGSWVGPATGNYYQRDNRGTAQARDTFKMVDDKAQFLIAQGQTDRTSGLSGWIIRFDLEAALEQGRVTMTMRNLKLAASNTGSLTNDGFQPLGSWYRFKSNYAALEAVANTLKACILA